MQLVLRFIVNMASTQLGKLGSDIWVLQCGKTVVTLLWDFFVKKCEGDVNNSY